MKKRKVLQVIGGGEFGGAERHLLTLMRLLNREIFSPVLLCLCAGPLAGLGREEGIPTHEIIMKHKLDWTTIKPIRRLIREEEIDLVHTHGVRANLVARIAAAQESVPVVTTFHSVLRYDYRSSWEAFVARMLTIRFNDRTDRFIAVSGAIKTDLIKMGVPADKIEVIYNGLELSHLRPSASKTELKARLGIAPERTVIGLVGRLHAVKGQIYFLEAAHSLVQDFPNLLFLLAGEGTERDNIEQKVRELGLEDHVLMTGFCSDMSQIYPVIDILCMPSLMEGLGFVLLEAMYFGIPVIASRVGGIPEIVQEGKNGLLIEPRDSRGLAQAIARLLHDPALAAALARSGRETVKEFTPENMAAKTESLYLGVLKQRKLV